ncbi:pectin acetylesterase [Chloropicon roscoffensis]|uniref:Pectin acetylesterase n=1 Tax=Chloropicon roscoffensis TaxID=1461544 RepID=A0AAX4P4B0_9CHLO
MASSRPILAFLIAVLACSAWSPRVEAIGPVGDAVRNVLGRFGRDKSDWFDLVLLENDGLKEGAVCLDGSPSGYWFRKGNQENKWLIFIEGGGWCYDERECLSRSRTFLGSSDAWPRDRPVDRPLFSADPKVNPTFYDWNIVNVGYCDGASFSGNVTDPVVVDGKKIYFRGARILDQVMRHVKEKQGLSGDVILSGCSAGGLTTILHADKVAAQLSDVTTSFRAMPFSGFFPITPNFQGDPWFRVRADNVYKMQRVEPSLNEACLADNADNAEQRCFEAEHAYRYIKTPIFLINSLYDAWTVQNIYNITSDTVPAKDVPKVVPFLNERSRLVFNLIRGAPNYNNVGNGDFLHSCMTHCGGCCTDEGWDKVSVKGETVRDAIGRWVEGGNGNNVRTDDACVYTNGPPYQCNPTCPPFPPI